MHELIDLREAAREIFATAMHDVDAGDALRRFVRLDGSRLALGDKSLELPSPGTGTYAIAAGKAALAMAAALDNVLGERLSAGVISGPDQPAGVIASKRWQFFAGGHPLPNQQSLNAAQAAIDLLKLADKERALVVFLISGGGSAMMEWPIDEQITLADLSAANHLLVSCGASIAEINVVRRAVSAVKGGRLAAQAPNATQITLIVSDTNSGDEASVASGPTIMVPADVQDARRVVSSYETLARLPPSILKVLNQPAFETQPALADGAARKHYVLLDNRSALAAAAAAARRFGFLTEVAFDLVETGIEEGCAALLARLDALRTRHEGAADAVCLISGGEFLCPLRGRGVGGRNAETVLRCAIEIDRSDSLTDQKGPVVVLSAGTDGIDGNSPAAGAIADPTTLERARALDLDAHSSLAGSDAFNFFNRLGDALITGATGTNVRDLRIFLAR